MKERKARVEDALHATRAAVEEGIVAGGGVALLRCAKVIEALQLEGDEKIGSQIVRRAIEYPIRMLCANAGVEPGVVTQKVFEGKGNFGYNVATGEYEDLVKAGVVDPTKVTRTALQNASSIAGLLLTTECMITEIRRRGKLPRLPAAAAWWHGLLSPIAASSASQNFKALRFSGRLFFADRSRLGAAMSPARRSCWRAVRCHRQVARVFDWRSRRSQTCANLGLRHTPLQPGS